MPNRSLRYCKCCFSHCAFLRWLSCILALAFLTLRFLSFSEATSGSWYLFAAFPYPSSAYSQMLSMATSEAEGGSSGLHKAFNQPRKACSASWPASLQGVP